MTDSTISSNLSRIRLLLGGVHENNRDYVSQRLCDNIDGVVSCQFVDENNFFEILFDPDQVDQFTLLTGIQRLGHPVQMFNSESVTAQLRIEGMHCNSCVSNICSTVLDLPGVIDIHLTFLDKLATVTYDASIILLEDIVSEIEKLDFQVAISSASQLSKELATSSRFFPLLR